MPPFIPSKRRHSNPQDGPAPKSLKKGSLFDAVDEPCTSATLQEHRAFLDRLNAESSLSDIGISGSEASGTETSLVGSTGDEEDEEVDWEDAIHADAVRPEQRSEDTPDDIVIDIHPDAHAQFISSNPYGKKKGPTKVERQTRVATHRMHVQFLLFHNFIRNAWCCDKEAQSILVNQLPSGVKKEVDKWRALSGMIQELPGPSSHSSSKGKQGKHVGRLNESERNQRDWGKHAEKQEVGVPDLSRGDPLIRLLKVLASYWKKKFTITAPGLRKQGYKSLATLNSEVTSFKRDKHDVEKHGERVAGVRQFRNHARICEGSRDVGAQLFTALVRGLGIEARLVASLQPVGFGWGKGEEALAKRKKKNSDAGLAEYSENASQAAKGLDAHGIGPKALQVKRLGLPKRGSGRGSNAREINASVGNSDDSDAHSTASGGDGESLVEVPRSSPSMKRKVQYDRDILFPTYWTEAISPITNHIFPVDSLVLSPAVATCEEHLAAFEPRGAEAEKAKLVFAYVVAYSSDGSAKDVTTRYLRRHIWPGRTKGVRLPVEKVAVHNSKGKIKYYEDYDWFKTVMRGYMRTDEMRTALDDLEDAKDLKPIERKKPEPKGGHETLQFYKTSADFVLERHLRREEAILPGSEPVKTFSTGRGANAKEEPVYSRKDIAICRTGESWHKEGRQVKAGEQPIKMVPVRAVTLTRKREVEEAERFGGEKIKQGLYAWDQTDWIIPPPIQNGVIPKNAYGNMDCYVPTMVPQGAVHIPLRSTSKICKRLGIDFAEACTGFEFGNQRAVPVITGVVVAAEHEDLVMAEWEKDEAERKAKEEGKRERIALAMWRKMLVGLKIMKRVQEDYGGGSDGEKKDDMNPFTNKHNKRAIASIREVSLTPADETFSTGDLTAEMNPGSNSAGEVCPNFDAHNARKHSSKNGADSSEMEGGGFIIEPEDGLHETHTPPFSSRDRTPGSEMNIQYNTENNKNQSIQSREQHGQDMKSRKSNKKPTTSNERNSTLSIKPAPTPQSPSKNSLHEHNAIFNPKPTATATSSFVKETPTRLTAPKRAAAARSERAVRSQYFTYDSDDRYEDNEAENSDSDEEHVHQHVVAASRKRRGRPSTRRRSGG
jgi:xeroderma pigmentosum group C-complementing protein